MRTFTVQLAENETDEQAGGWKFLSQYHVTKPMTRLETGDAIVDAKYLGTAVILTSDPVLKGFLDRCMDEYRQSIPTGRLE